MIVVIASRYDEIARALVARWEAYDARLLTCEDLSVCGWRYYPSDSRLSTAVIGGQEVAQDPIARLETFRSSSKCVMRKIVRQVTARASRVAIAMLSYGAFIYKIKPASARIAPRMPNTRVTRRAITAIAAIQ